MKFRAVAKASPRSSAVGSVEVECLPDGLSIAYLGVGRFNDGYAPGALTEGTRITAPWSAIEEARLDADELFVQLAEGLTPHDRMVLVNFSAGESPSPEEMRRRQTIIATTVVSSLLLLVLIGSLTLPRVAPNVHATGALLLGFAAAATVLGLGLFAKRQWLGPSVSGPAAQRLFVSELRIYLPHFSVSPQRRPVPVKSLSWHSLLPRSTTAIVITLSTLGLSALLTSSWVLEGSDGRSRVSTPAEPPRQTPPGPSPAPAAPQPTPTPAATAAPPPAPSQDGVASVGGACTCDRADSVLWRDGIPLLSSLLISKRSRPHKNHRHLELELAVVNNGEDGLLDITLQVHFFEEDPPPSKKRTHTKDRPLYFQGPLSGGKAIKWHVDARATVFEVQHSVPGVLDPKGREAAPSSRFAELLDANHRPVRLHGAMMLAYLRDPRAKEAALSLRDALREEEAPYLNRVLNTQKDVRACDVQISQMDNMHKVQCCIYNASDEPRNQLAIKLRALDAPVSHQFPVAHPPLVQGEKQWTVPGTLGARKGLLTTTKLKREFRGRGNQEPTIEVLVDRADLLP
ncbi:MAG: hypothetical protein HRU17_24490 [Polyangiaceae bacterium]|nr:hypothetical protein [Polyangiaceae bacterium]